MSKPWWYSEKHAQSWQRVKDVNLLTRSLYAGAVCSLAYLVSYGFFSIVFYPERSFAEVLLSSIIQGFFFAIFYTVFNWYWCKKSYQYYQREDSSNP